MPSFLKRRFRWRIISLAGVLGALLLGVLALYPVGSSAHGGEETVTPVFSATLPNAPGKSITAVLVSFAPGARSVAHHHAGSVFAFIVSGSILSENSATGPARIYKAGEAFFEPPGSKHLMSDNASATAPASLLAVFIADTAEGANLTIDEP